jgi:hypothetical protein
MNLRQIPWVFIAQMALACVPMIDANAVHGFWSGLIVYATVLATLQYADKFALGRQWGVWRRIGLMAVIVVVAEVAVSVSASERCNIEMTKCDRIFSATVLLAVVVAVLILASIIDYFSSRTGAFWRLAATKADLALVLFSMEPHCLVDQSPRDAQRTYYAGPFRLRDHLGQTHKVYIDGAHIDEIQARLTQDLKASV